MISYIFFNNQTSRKEEAKRGTCDFSKWFHAIVEHAWKETRHTPRKPGVHPHMILAVHQPIFLPWTGFFFKAIHSDGVALLNDVQFPRGRSWLNRNRLKNAEGALWLTVPVWKKGRGLQVIRQVEIYNENNWRKKHLRSIQQNYSNAPYFDDYFEIIESIYRADHKLLADFNIALIRFLWEALSPDKQLLFQSHLGATGKGTNLLINICKSAGADQLTIFPIVDKYIDITMMERNGIEIVHAHFHPPVYPQLWGDFIYNLSTLDLLMNCGPKSREIITGSNNHCPPQL